MLTRPSRRGRQLPLAQRAGQGGVGEGELGEQHGDVVVEPVPGMRAKPIQQFVSGRLQVGLPERLDLLVQPEELASAVSGLQQPGVPARSGSFPAVAMTILAGGVAFLGRACLGT
jgi:hypothetical protein